MSTTAATRPATELRNPANTTKAKTTIKPGAILWLKPENKTCVLNGEDRPCVFLGSNKEDEFRVALVSFQTCCSPADFDVNVDRSPHSKEILHKTSSSLSPEQRAHYIYLYSGKISLNR
jgi:hypothetical protein